MMKIDFSLSFLSSVFLAIPFYFLWNHLAPVYLPQLPPLYLNLPFWHCVGIFILIWIFRVMLLPSGQFMFRPYGKGAWHEWKK